MNANAITSRDVLARLAAVPPAALAGPALLVRLIEMDRDATLTHVAYIQVQPDIERAIKEMEEHARLTKEVVSRCCKLSASPTSQQAPAGF
ncbi:MAG: hypothetical protein JW934_16460 [Anaerolineae bacterium]|nr:hypothetical protein [Anaerolineae bacterium]